MARTISDTVTEICALRHGIENAAWEEARGKLMAYLRLRGSCVGGDQEEYNALEAVIKEFIERIDEDDIYSPSSDEITRLREENARLKEALEKFNVYLLLDTDNDHDTRPVMVWHLRAARAALKEPGDEKTGI